MTKCIAKLIVYGVTAIGLVVTGTIGVIDIVKGN